MNKFLKLAFALFFIYSTNIIYISKKKKI